MGNKVKKFISIAAAALMAGSVLAMTACNAKPYALENPLSYTSSDDAAKSNGGFAVEKGDYVYFVNGQALSDSSNKYGDVQKGSLMRISKANLQAGNYAQADVVVPLLFVNGNMDSGIYIYGDYVYFATPTTDKDLDGNVMSYKLDFKRARLDGTEVMSDFYFRTETNNVQYRFVKGDDGAIYCMYVEDGVLKSYNTATGANTVLVKGAVGGYVFDKSDSESDTVYYTMNVPNMFVNTDDAANEVYTQIYRVSATATVTVDADNASYTAKDGDKYSKTYDFDENFFNRKNEEAKKADKKAKEPYNLEDYTTYTYVNLGELVVDGIGSSDGQLSVPTDKTWQYHDKADYDAAKGTAEFTELKGYTYSIQSQQNGGIYFTRSLVNSTENDIANLYYLANETVDNSAWNTVAGNSRFTVVSENTTNASSSAIYYLDSNGVHNYLYVSGDKLMRAAQPSANLEEVTVARKGFTSRKLLYISDNYLYTYMADTKALYRIDYTGAKDDYHAFAGNEEYEDVRILEIEFNTSWYAPEFFGEVLLYNNAQTVNGTAYNYINAVSLKGANGMMTVAELKALNEKYTEVTDYIESLKGDKKLSAAAMTYFRTGSRAAVDAVVAEYGDTALSTTDLQEFDAFVGHKVSERKPSTSTQKPNDYTEMFKDEAGNYYDVESYFVGVLGDNVSDADKEAMAAGWQASIYTVAATEETEEKAGLQWWAWLLIALGGVIVIAAAAVLVLYLRKRSKKAMEERMRTSKRKKKIDTTDDKSIDVYADDDEPTTEGDAVVDAVAVEEASAETVVDAAAAENGSETVENDGEEAAPETAADDAEKTE